MNQQFKTPIPYGPDGCQVHIGNQICRETQTLQIIKEFNRIYESKLNELGSIGGGDNLSAKVHLQQDWIRDLTLQNEMLARTVEELEKEAAERVTMLESQLHCGSQVMQRYKDKFSVYLNETFQNLDYLQNDVSSLIEFVRRVRDNNEWSIDGLNFYTIKPSCLLKTCSVCDCPGPYPQNLLPVPDANELQLQKQETGPGGPKAADLEELNLKLRLKEEELNSMKRRSADVETDCSELRKRFKELEDENNQLKDTIFQANRELEKFYEQANDYLKERDEYKRLYNESVDALTLAERKSMMHEEALSKMNEEHVKIKEEITTCRRQSESLSQAQNETIQALQEAIREKEKASELVPLTSDESWTSTTVSTTTKGPICSCYSIGPPVDDGTPKDPSHIKKDGVSVKEIECPKPYPCAGEKLQQDLDAEREIHKKEVDNLKKTITELEKGGLDTIKSLEDAYEESKLEISHQRITISNLQEALKVCKGQLDELEKKSSSDMENFTHLEYKCVVYFNQIKKLNAFIDHLQETNLGLEVDIFEYVQDVALLESRLLKYQSNFRMGYDLRNRVKELECECEAMKRIVNEAKELHQSYRIMQTTKEDLQVEAEYARQELMRESQLKGLNEARIQELQQRLGEKTCEVSRCDDMLSDMQNKLCWAVCQNNQLKKDVSTLLCHVNNYEQNYIDNDERTDICQQEIEVCKENLTDLKDKLLMMKGLLQQKIDEYTQLETKFCAQSKSLACMNEQISLSEQQYEKEICILRCTVEELQNKLLASEANCECLREDYERTQVAMQDYAQMESKLQKEFATNINEAHNEIVTLNTYVNQLQNECSCIKQELKAKEQQIGSAKAQIAHYRMSESADFVALQDENKRLRNELNRVVQQHETFQAKNEALCMQLCEVKKSAMSFERQAQMNERHLQKCMYELQHLRDVKDQLEVANDELRCAYKELCARYQEVLVSVPILNNEIVEYKSKNEDLLTESRNLINNVRAWLENQALINQEVSQKFSDDHLVIRNLSQKIVALQKYQCPHSSSRLHAGSNLEGSESITSDASVESEENIDQSPKAIDNSDEDMDEIRI